MSEDADVRLRRTWPQRFTILLGISVVFGALASAWTVTSLYRSVGGIQRVIVGPGVLDDLPDVGSGKKPRNILLVGSTENEGIDEGDPLLAGRGDAMLADTIMLLRLDPASDVAAVMSINRDLWVQDTVYSGRINGALQTGGVESLVQVVQNQLRVPVNNFVRVNFAGFRKLVDELNGVPVYFPYPARDRGSFFDMPEAGCHVLDGTAALDYVRSRSYEELIDGRWRADRGYDYRRTERQRDFLILALDRAIQKGGRNPVMMRRLVRAATDGGAVILDELLKPDELIDLGVAFAGFNPENLQRYQLPVVDRRLSSGAQVLEMVREEAEPILDIFRGLGSTLRPEQVRLAYVDARGKVDEQVRPDRLLSDRGFTISSRKSTKSGDVRSATTITYSADQRNAALLLARHVAPLAAFEAVTGLRHLTLTIGSDWEGVALVPWPEEYFAGRFPGVTVPPTTTTTAAASTTTAPAAPNGTTTVPAEIPDGDDVAGVPTTEGIIGRAPEGVVCK